MLTLIFQDCHGTLSRKFHKNDSIERPIEKSVRKHCFSKKQNQDGTVLTEETRKGHIGKGILITPQQQDFCEPVLCQVRLGSQQKPSILTLEAREQSGS